MNNFDVTNIQIETDRLLLRAFTEADVDDMFAYASIPGVGEMAGWPHHTSKEVTKIVISSFFKTKDVFALFHKGDKKVIGSLGVHSAWTDKDEEFKHLKAKNIGYVLSKEYWGQGLMPEAVKAVIEYGFNVLGLDAFSIEHFMENIQSRRVIEKCGFKFVKTGVYYADQLNKNFDEMRYILTK